MRKPGELQKPVKAGALRKDGGSCIKGTCQHPDHVYARRKKPASSNVAKIAREAGTIPPWPLPNGSVYLAHCSCGETFISATGIFTIPAVHATHDLSYEER